MNDFAPDRATLNIPSDGAPPLVPMGSRPLYIGGNWPVARTLPLAYDQSYFERVARLERQGFLSPVVFVDQPGKVDDRPVLPKGGQLNADETRRLKELLLTVLTILKAEADRPDNKHKEEELKQLKQLEEQVKNEFEAGRFGDASKAAWKKATDFIETKTMGALRMLDASGVQIPVGCPVPIPFDKSGRHIGDQLFRAKLHKGEITFKINQSGDPEGWPNVADLVRAEKAFDWTGEAISFKKSAELRKIALILDDKVKSLESSDRPWVGFHPPKELIERDFTKETREVREQKDKALERWIYSRAEYIDAATTAERYAKTIAFLNHMSERNSQNGFDPSIKWAIKAATGVNDHPFPDDALKTFPGKVYRDRNGLVTKVEFEPPSDPSDAINYHAYLAKVHGWVESNSRQVDQVIGELQRVCVKDGVDKNRLVMVDSSDLLLDENGRPDQFPKYPPGHPKAGEVIGKCNFVRSSVDVTRDGDFYVIRPYTQYYYAHDWAYNHWEFTGGMQPVGDKIQLEEIRVRADEYVACLDHGRLNLIRADKVEQWKRAIETGEQAEKWVDTAIDVSMLVGGLEEYYMAYKFYRIGGKVAARETLAKVFSGTKSLAFAGSGFGKQLIENYLDDWYGYGTGHKFSQMRGYLMMADLSHQAFTPSGVRKRIAYGEGGARRVTAFEEAIKYEAGWYGRGVMAGGRVSHGAAPLIDFYLIDKEGSAGLNKIFPGDASYPADLKEAKRLREEEFEARRPVLRPPTLEEVQEQSNKVFGEYSDHLARASTDPDKHSILLQREINAFKAQPGRDPQACIAMCLKAFANPHSSAEKQVAAHALLELLPAGQQVKLETIDKDGRKVLIDRKQIEDFLDHRAEVLYKQTAEIEAKKLDVNNPERKKHVEKLVEIFLTADTYAEKLAAAVCLAKLEGKDGLLTGALGQARVHVPGTDKDILLTLHGEEVNRFLSRSAERVLKKGADVLLLPGDNSPDGMKRKAAIDDSANTFRTSTSPEEKLAAAVALLSVRKRTSPDELLASTTNYRVTIKSSEGGKLVTIKEVNFTDQASALAYQNKYKDSPGVITEIKEERNNIYAAEVLHYVKTQALNSESPRLRLLAADCLLRQSSAAEFAVEELESKHHDLQVKLTASPNDINIRRDLENCEDDLRKAKQFALIVRFDYADMAQVCLEVLNDPNAPKDVRASALVGKTGPRLDYILRYLKHVAEPSVDALDKPGHDAKAERARLLRMKILAALERIDSKKLEHQLEQFANDKNQDADLRALTCSIVMANRATRQSVNGMPVSTNSSFEVGHGSNSYIKVDGVGVQDRHALLRIDVNGHFFIKPIDSKGDIWIKTEAGATKHVFQKDGKNFVTTQPPGETRELKPDEFVHFGARDKVTLGDEQNGSVLKISLEREDLLARTRREWGEYTGQPDGSYAKHFIKDLKSDFVLDAKQLGQQSPYGVGGEKLVNKYRATVALEMLGGLSDLGDDATTKDRLNKSFVDCFASTLNPEAFAEMFAHFSKERLASMKEPELRDLRLKVIQKFSQCASEISGKDPDDPDARSLKAFLMECCEKLPFLFSEASAQEKGEVVALLVDLILEKPGNLKFPENFPTLRIAAIDALAKFSPETARTLLPQVVRVDKVPEVRLRALYKLKEIGFSGFRQLCIERLSEETDPLILSRLYDFEYFARRPDRASAEYQRAFRKACEDLDGRTFPRKGWEEMPAYCGSPDQQKDYERTCFVGGDVKRDAPFNYKYVQSLVYEILTNGRYGLGDLSSRDWHVLQNVKKLNEMCAIYEGENAKTMACFVVACILHQSSMEPEARQLLITALEQLHIKGAISTADLTTVLCAALQNEMQRTPKVDDPNELNDLDYMKLGGTPKQKKRLAADNLQLKIVQLLTQRCSLTRVPPIFDAIADTKDYPLLKTKMAVESFVVNVGESTQTMRQLVKVDAGRSDDEIAASLKEALKSPRLDAESFCHILCSSFNGRPVKTVNDPRRMLLHEACRDTHPRVQMLAATFLFESDIKEDREFAARIIASMYRRPNVPEVRGYRLGIDPDGPGSPDGYKIDVRQLLEDVKKDVTYNKYKKGDLDLLEYAIKSAKEEGEARTAAGGGPILCSSKQDDKPRKDTERSLDYQWEYEKALTNLKRGWLRDLRDIQDVQPFPQQYRLLNGTVFNNDIAAIKHPRKKNEEELIKAKTKEMWDQLDLLIAEAAKNPNGFESKFLKFVIYSNGSPFPTEHQAEALQRVAVGIRKICSSQNPNDQNRMDFEGILASALIESPMLPQPVRTELLQAYLALVDDPINKHFGRISKKDAAITLAAVLQTEYKFMPKRDARSYGYEWSVQRQSWILDHLAAWDTREVGPILEATAKNHPDFQIKDKAERILRDFAVKDVDDLLSGKATLGNVKLLKDDPIVKVLIHEITWNSNNPAKRLKCIDLLRENGAPETIGHYLYICRSAWSEIATTCPDENLRFEAARKLYSLGSDWDRRIALDSILRIALSAKTGVATDARMFIQGLQGADKELAMSLLGDMVDPRFDNSRLNNQEKYEAAKWLTALADEKTPDYRKQQAVKCFVELAISGDATLRPLAESSLEALPPKDKLKAAEYALTWCTSHKNADKQLISNALFLCVSCYIGSGDQAKSPMLLFSAYSISKELLGADHLTTLELQAFLDPGSTGCLIKPLKNPDDYDLSRIRTLAESSKDDHMKLAAAYTLVQKGNEGVRQGDGYYGMKSLTELALHSKDEKIREVAHQKLFECVTKENVLGVVSVVRQDIEDLKKDEKANRDKLLTLLTLLCDLYAKAGIPVSDRHYAYLIGEKDRIEKGLEPLDVRMRKRYEAADKSKDWRVQLPGPPVRELEEQIDQAIRTYGRDSLEVARLNLRLAKCWIHFGIWGADDVSRKVSLDSACTLLERTIILLEKRLGPDSPEVADAVYRLATAKLAQGKFDDAVPLLRRSLAIYEKTNDKAYTADRAWIMAALAYASSETGDKATAKDMQQRLIALSKEDLSREDLTEVKSAMIRLAQHYRGEFRSKVRDFDAAETLFNEALRLEEKLSGENSPPTAFVLWQLGNTKVKAGRPADAIADYKRSLQIFELTKDDYYDAQKAEIMGELSLALYRAGDRKGAKEYAEKIIELARKSHSKEMTSEISLTLTIMGHRYTNFQTYDPVLAELFFKEALVLEKSISGDKSTAYALCLHNLAMTQFNQKKYAEAAVNWKQASAIYESSNDPALAVRKGDTLLFLAMASRNAGDEKTAAEAVTSLIALAHSGLPNDKLIPVRNKLFTLASFYMDLPDRTKQDAAIAENQYREVLRIEENLFGKDSPQAAHILRYVAHAESAQGKYVEASADLKTAIRIYDSKKDKSLACHKATALYQLSIVAHKSGDSTTAKESCDQLLQLCGEDYSDKNDLFDIKERAKYLGRYYAGLIDKDVHDYEAAERLLKTALHMEEKLGHGQYPMSADTAIDLAFVLRKQAEQNPNTKDAKAKLEESLSLLERARKIYEKVDQADETKLADIWEQTAYVYNLLGLKDKADAAFETAKKLRMKTLKPQKSRLPMAG